MKNPIIIDGEILLSDEDIFLLIRERLGNEVANEIQRIIDDLQMENAVLNDSVEDHDACEKQLWKCGKTLEEIEVRIRKLIRKIETEGELDRTDLRNQALKIYNLIDCP